MTARAHPTRNLLLPLAALILAALACGRTASLEQGTLVHDGLERTYYLLVPSSYDPATPTPLVLMLHGGGGNGRQVCRMKGGVAELAEAEGFLVLCPEGIDAHWNDGRTEAPYRPHQEQIDDVGFLLHLLDHIAGQYNVDERRVFVTGVSNGGIMTFRLACEAADRFAAAAPVIGSMAEGLDCHPARPLSILVMNGTEDPLVPWEGGSVRFGERELGRVIPVESAVAFWVQANGCDPEPQREWLPDTDPEDGSRVERVTYTGCRQATQVVLYRVEGGGHTWPGGSQYAPKSLIGTVNRDLHAGEVIWSFFQAAAP